MASTRELNSIGARLGDAIIALDHSPNCHKSAARFFGSFDSAQEFWIEFRVFFEILVREGR
jgi:hypothetical protein